MNLDVERWKPFKINAIFDVYTGGDLIMGEIDEGHIPIASNSAENNNIAAYSDFIPNRKLFDCKKSISIADRGKFWAFIQANDFYLGTRAKSLVCKEHNVLNFYQMTFIVSIINQESFKFSYGRNCCANLSQIDLYLPAKHNPNGSIFRDKSKTYSKFGYVPDFEFMENYIKSLHYKPLTTKNRPENALPLNIEKWGEFSLKEIFNINRGKRLVKDEDYFDDKDEIYKFPVITAKTTDNGVDGYYNESNCNGNCIIACGEASGMYSTYQKEPCWVMDTARIFSFKENMAIEFTPTLGLFFATLLTYNMYRFSYGRKAKPSNMNTIIIKLPINHKGELDFEFMENYIKSLPYGDRI
ncbi:restriction endonuclease subunit S [Campylobacter upsaliensis]